MNLGSFINLALQLLSSHLLLKSHPEYPAFLQNGLASDYAEHLAKPHSSCPSWLVASTCKIGTMVVETSEDLNIGKATKRNPSILNPSPLL